MDHQPKKDVQLESCEFSFIWNIIRTVVWETAPQLALRNCSREVEGKVNIYDFGEGGVHAVKHLPYKRLPASHQGLMSP